MYPNPATSSICVGNGYDSVYEYEIFDTTGRKMLFGTAANHQLIDIQMLATGNYFVKIIDNQGKSMINKIIKN